MDLEQRIDEVINQVERTLYEQHSYVLPPSELVRLRERLRVCEPFNMEARLRLQNYHYLCQIAVHASISSPDAFASLSITAVYAKEIKERYSLRIR